ncbi:MAG: hypothetical protein HZC17_02375 [Candidatus Omnitrophica bacterium]|nr:hypothetical protein [Candidatus Omnitrophota bacterium]
MKKLGLSFFVLLLILSLNVKSSFASVRQYVWTQEYRTLPKGTVELESYTTFKVPNSKFTNSNSIEYKGEVEYGLTDRLNLAHYENWQTNNRRGLDDSTVYTGFKFEGKYRLLDKGKLPVDILLYFEIEDNVQNKNHPLKLEEKLIVSKDFKKLNVVYNQILESDLGQDGRTEPGFSFATKYELFPSFYAGCEFFGNYWEPSSHRNKLSIGPTIAWENQWFWVTMGVAFGANNAADDFQGRVIVGFEF